MRNGFVHVAQDFSCLCSVQAYSKPFSSSADYPSNGAPLVASRGAQPADAASSTAQAKASSANNGKAGKVSRQKSCPSKYNLERFVVFDEPKDEEAENCEEINAEGEDAQRLFFVVE